MNVFRAIKLFSLFRDIIKNDFQSASTLMGEMHGFPQKIGQHLTLYPGNQNNQYFQNLYDTSKIENIPVYRILKALKVDYRKVETCAQASIGQVYRVETDTQSLAVKVKYPKVEKKINSDFKLLRILMWPTKYLPLKNSNLLPLIEQLRLMLLSECDYKKEAEIQKRFHSLFDNKNTIFVPEVYDYNNHAIVSSWVAGGSLTDYPGAVEPRFVLFYLEFILQSLTRLGMIHADPHPGNFILTGNSDNFGMAVIDFGSVASFNPNEAKAVTRLLLGDYEDELRLASDLRILGVSGEVLEVYQPIIGDLVSIVLEPIYYQGEYDFTNWRLQYKLNTLLASRDWEKPMDIPLKLLLLFRTIQGIYFYARTNLISINWHSAIRKFLR